MCKVTCLPSCAFLHLEVAPEGRPKEYREGDPLRAMSRRGLQMVRKVAEEKEARGLKKFSAALSCAKVFPHLWEPRKIPRRTTWYTQVFVNGQRFAGELPSDICHMGVAKEMVTYMVARSKLIQFRLSPELHAWFKRYATRNNTTMTDVLVAYIEKLRRADENATRVEQI